jgi:hypothetical protein
MRYMARHKSLIEFAVSGRPKIHYSFVNPSRLSVVSLCRMTISTLQYRFCGVVEMPEGIIVETGVFQNTHSDIPHFGEISL